MPKAVNLELNFTAEENARADLCEEKIRKLLEEDGCKLVVAHYIAKDGRPQGEIHVIPDPAKADVPRTPAIQIVRTPFLKSIQPNGKPLSLE
jgi:hypothetical protein